MIRARVNIETAQKAYGPGDVITEKLSDADMNFLKEHHFIIDDEDAEAAAEKAVRIKAAATESTDLGQHVEEDESEECGGIGYRDESALKKMNKEEIVAYAAEIGLKLDVESLKNDLIDAVLNYQEENMAE